MSEKAKYIYILYHESSDKYYVGQAFNLKDRYYNHLNSHKYAGNKSNIKDCWIKSLLSKGLVPEMKQICKCSSDQADFFEIMYIDLLVRLGFKILNGTLGGSNNSGGHTEETKRKIGEAHKGLKMSPEHNYYLHQVVLKDRKVRISERLKKSLSLIGNKRRVGLSPSNKGKRRLSDEQVKEIKDKLNKGILGRIIAKEYNVPESTISSIRHDKYNLVGWGYSSSANSWKTKDKVTLAENSFYLMS